MLLLIILTGYGITKAGVFSPKTRADMTDIVVYVVLPCSIFSSFHKGITTDIIMQCIVVFAASLSLQLFVIVLNRLIYKKYPPERRVVLQYATITNNSSFMGLPILGAVFGPTGILYGSIMLIPMRIFMWTSGLSLFTRMNKKESVKVLATHPCMWAVILGIAYIFVPFELPAFLSVAISTVGETVRVLPMFIIGSILCDIRPRDMLDKDCYYYSAFRLFIIPAVMFGALTLLRVDAIVTGVVVLAAAMPTAVTAGMLSEKYGQDSAFASKIILVSTMLSIVTLPAIAAVMQLLSPV